MKDWIIELCPEIADWQAELIDEAVAARIANEREACYTIAKFNQSNHLEHLTADQIKARGKTK